MKTLHFDCYAGISGDMTLGALVDLGVDPDKLRSELVKLGVEGWHLEFTEDERCGIRGLHALVGIEGQPAHAVHEEGEDAPDHHSHEDERHHTHGEHHGHEHQHPHSRDHGGHDHSHDHNSWKEIRALIENSGISGGAKKRALDIFSRIAKAESEVHGVLEDEIRFHEVGALDSIIDVVGAAICLDMLKPDRITCGEIELGGGTVTCAHGILPVPAPAVQLLVRGLPVKTGGFNKEMTTPTGAAILAASVDEFISTARFTEIKTGIGIGTRKTDRPNVLRVSWREENPEPNARDHLPYNIEELTLIETNIDDMSGEALGFLMERLFDAGALDVTFSPCVMKKSRPGTIVSVLGSPQKLPALRTAMFEHSLAIGFREIPVRRLSLKREETKITGGFGEARCKTVYYGDRRLRSKIEFEDRARIARERNIPLDEAERIIERILLEGSQKSS
ncbi:MAG: nickel pincer cofactor biosynthesis protein LarC [Treponema sp.]|nr:nickel pincer cofactor biosynthesis protein LarC [Treponema sp.]